MPHLINNILDIEERNVVISATSCFYLCLFFQATCLKYFIS